MSADIMWKYIFKRLLQIIPLSIGITLISFLIMQMAPGDFLSQMEMNPQIPREVIDDLRSEYGLDQPVLIQYGKWLWGVVRLDLGYSFSYRAPVIHLVASRVFNTLILSISALSLTWLLAIPMGIYSAVNRGKRGDQVFSILAFIGMSVPGFFFALLLVFFAAKTGILPTGGMVGPGHAEMGFWRGILDYLHHLVVPTIVLSASALAYYQRILRGNMIEILSQQYITTARAKGLPERTVIYKHALRNAINPLVTIFGYELSALLSGAALVEIICSWPGLGRLMLDAVLSKDLYLVMGGFLMSSVLLILGNLIADILLVVVDPRIRYR
jgi:peptide/nickel transport system permease protein